MKRQLQILALAGFSLLGSIARAETPMSANGPFPPDVAKGMFVLPDDCKIELAASEPDVIDPVAIAFGADGLLWVVEYTDYPNGPKDGEPGLSRIRILEDKDGDGRYENSRTFADKLLFANGLMCWKGGVIVTTDGKVMYMKDEDGDGRADLQQVWFEGFQTENPQLRCNHPTLGLDNLIYIANGLRGGQIVPGKNNPWGLDPQTPPLSISGMDFRFDPFTGKHEAVAGMGQFALTFDDWGNRFTCNNRHPCMQVMLQDADLKRTPWLRPKQVYVDVSPAEFNSRLYPISRTWTTSNLHANQFTAACGTLIYRGSLLPESYYGNSFVCEPTANLVHRDVLNHGPSHYIAAPRTEEKEFLATKDEWFRPVNLTTGPDGSLFICDMYRAVIEHPQFMPDELKNRPDLLLGTDMGRLWKISAKAKTGTVQAPVRINDATSAQLVQLLKHPNQWQRETAQRLLLERQDKAIEGDLAALVKDPNSHFGAPLALWVLDGLQLLREEHLVTGFNHPYARRAALQLGRKRFADSKAIRELPQKLAAQDLTSSPDPFVFEQMLINTSWKDLPAITPESKNSPRRTAIRNIPADGEHEWYCSMLVINAGDDLLDVCKEALKLIQQGPQSDEFSQIGPGSIRFLTAALARRNQKQEVQQILEAVFSQPGTSKNGVFQRAVLDALLDQFPQAVTQLPVLVAELTPAAQQNYNSSLRSVLDSFVNSSSEADRNLTYLPLLILLPLDETLPVVKQLANSSRLEDVTAAIEMLRKLPGNSTAPVLAELVTTGTPQIRRSSIAALTVTVEGIMSLLDMVEAKEVAPLEIDPAIAKRLMESKNAEVKSRAVALLKQSPPADRVKVLAEYTAALSLPSDPKRGMVIFEKNCATCHQVNGIGFQVGPDVSDSYNKTSDFLLTNILDPNRAVDNNYFSFTIADTDGLVHTGVIASETTTAVTLKQAEGKLITIPRESIEMMKNNGVSLMPVGLERTINPQEMADLISFIKNWRYMGGQVPSEVIRKTLQK